MSKQFLEECLERAGAPVRLKQQATPEVKLYLMKLAVS
jgi:hypothetical protein